IRSRHSCALQSMPGPPARLCAWVGACWAWGLVALICMNQLPHQPERMFLLRRRRTLWDLECVAWVRGICRPHRSSSDAPTRLELVIDLKTAWARLGNAAEAARVRISQAESV